MIVDDEFANRYGLEEGVLLSHLRYLCEWHRANGNCQLDGHTWCYYSLEALLKKFPCMRNTRRIQRALDGLVRSGVILRADPGRKQRLNRQEKRTTWDQTNWFCFSDEQACLRDRDGLLQDAKSAPCTVETDGTLDDTNMARSHGANMARSTKPRRHAQSKVSMETCMETAAESAAAAPAVILEAVSPRDGCVLPDAAADRNTQSEPTGRPTDALPVALSPPKTPLPTAAEGPLPPSQIIGFDPAAELLRKEGIPAAKAAALVRGRSVEEIREWIRIAHGRDKRSPSGFLIRVLPRDEPLPAAAAERIRDQERAMTRACHAQARERAQAHEPVPDLAVLFPEYAHRVRRWVDYRSAGAGVTVPATSPAPAAEWERNTAVGAHHTRELCHTMTDCSNA